MPDEPFDPKKCAETDRPTFRPFDPRGPVSVYVRSLPHWRQHGATYFVTFRQGDSIPENVLREWLGIRDLWYQFNGLNLALREKDPHVFNKQYQQIPEGRRRAFEREQARMLHEELDRCHGSCVLRQKEPRQIVVDSLRYFHGQRLWLGDWVVMPNHVHALITPIGDHELEDILGSIKKWTSRLIGMWLGDPAPELDSNEPDRNRPRFWQHDSYDRIVRDTGELTAFRKYILENPSQAQLLPEGYTYGAGQWLDDFAPLRIDMP